MNSPQLALVLNDNTQKAYNTTTLIVNVAVICYGIWQSQKGKIGPFGMVLLGVAIKFYI
jgi:hypothetical protein